MENQSQPPPTEPPTPESFSKTDFSKNPGTIEELHRDYVSIVPMIFEGGKLMINKGLSNNFQISHTLTLSNTQQSGYRFGATFVGPKMLSPTEAYPLLLGDINPKGDVNANMIHAFTDRLRCKFVTQIEKSQWQATQVTADYKGDVYSASLTAANPDLINGSGVGAFHYLRAITKNLSLGSECIYQAGSQIPGGHAAMLSLCGKYATKNSTFSLIGGNSGVLHATYYQKCSKNLKIGSEMQINLASADAVGTIAYEVEMNKGEFVLRGSVDSNYTVKSVVEKKLLPLPFTLALCSLLNHKKGQYQFGCGLIMG